MPGQFHNPKSYPQPETSYDFEDANAALAAAVEKATAIGGRVVRMVGTPSMEPLLRGQVYVVVSPTQYDELGVGDIAAYFPTNQFGKRVGNLQIVHRLVAKDKSGLIPSGDNNAITEKWMRVTPENYNGKLVAVFGFKDSEKTRKARLQ